MDSSPSTPVLIVGSGPAGVAAALTLARNGIKVRIVDKATSFYLGTRGSGIQPRTLEVFKFLGILPDVVERGSGLFPMRSYKLPGGVEVLNEWYLFPPKEPTPTRPLARQLSLRQSRLEQVFREHLAPYGVEVELGMELVDLQQDAHGVNAKFRKHSLTSPDHAPEEVTVRAAYVIGTDGAKGVTRKLIRATFDGQTKDDDSQVWADVHIEGLEPNYWHVWAEPGKFTAAARSLGEGSSTLFHCGVIGHSVDLTWIKDKDQFTVFFKEHTGRKDLKLFDFEYFSSYRPNMRIVDKFQEGRIFIGGDAAHVHSPSGGQGMNNSVQDSFNLAWKLAIVLKGAASPSLLTTYAEERLPVNKQMLIATTALYSHLSAKKAEELLPSAETSQSGFLRWRNEALLLFSVNYRWSPIVLDSRGVGGLGAEELKALSYAGHSDGTVRAGDRAPEAAGLVDGTGKSTSLFEFFKPSLHTVIVFSPDTAEDRSRVAVIAALLAPATTGALVQTIVISKDGVPHAAAGARVFHDKDGVAYEGYGVDRGKFAAVVIRPDAHIGAFVNSVEGVRKYFTRVMPGLFASA